MSRGAALRHWLGMLAITGGLVATSTLLSVGSAGASSSGVAPRAVGDIDCNGLSPVQQPAKLGLACADIRLQPHQRFEDNDHYIGHDEPSFRFLSSAPGSGDDFTMTEVLGRDPGALPTVSKPGDDVVHYFELTIAPWISMELCDPDSTPLLPCTPESDANAPSGRYPGAGSAFLELQFYPPGFAPFDDAVSCDNTHWCAALTIDSVECTQSGTCNNNCTEPVNFAFLQTDGVPTGPPSPQLADAATFFPNSRTLLMNPGDRITVHIFDAAISGGHALETSVADLTTGTSGYMIASAANGFMNTSIADCSGTPFNFQPEYATAKPQNVVPWGPGPYGINTEFEIGHFEPCTSTTGSGTFTIGTFVDHYQLFCHGPYETGDDRGSSAEPNDAPCFRKGDTHGGLTAPDEVTGCGVFLDAIGDLDYDGTSYRYDWPQSLTPTKFPTPFLEYQAVGGGKPYPQIQFMSDNSATQAGCNLANGNGCVMPPPGADFYPYWTLARFSNGCAWEFGDMRNGDTYGGDVQYGPVTASSRGTFVGRILPNPDC